MIPPQTAERRPDPAERLRGLLEVSARLSSKLGPRELYRAIYREVASALDAPAFYLALLDQGRDLGRIVLFADSGEPQDSDVTLRGSDLTVFRTQAPALVADAADEAALMVLGDVSVRPRSTITAPLRFDGRILGAISAQSYDADAYDDEDLDFLVQLANVAAVALHNSTQFEELERRRAEAEEFEAIGRALASELDITEILARVVTAVHGVVDAHGAAVWLRDFTAEGSFRVEESGGSPSLPIGLEWRVDQTHARALSSDGESLVVDDVAASAGIPAELKGGDGSGSVVAVAVKVAGRIEGLLTAFHERAHHFSADEARALHRIGTQFAVALGNARLHADLQAASLTDPLTGLPNRRRLQLHLEHEVAAARRGRVLGLAVMDIDRFKYYNDTFGHVAGDDILKALGAILSDENRAMNIVGRYGGDEFVSVLSGTTLEGAQLYAVRVGDRISKDPTLSKFGITVSIGVAQFDPDSMATVNDILRAADADMYEVKEAGERARASG